MNEVVKVLAIFGVACLSYFSVVVCEKILRLAFEDTGEQRDNVRLKFMISIFMFPIG